MQEIKNLYKCKRLNDHLDWCPEIGIAWQREMKDTIVYAENYWQTYVRLEHTPIAIALNKFRCELAERYCSTLLDIGIGSGEFIKKLRIPAYGYDINPIAVSWLKDRNLFRDPYTNFPEVDGISLWDVLEHIPKPNELLNIVPKDCAVLLSIPVFPNLHKVQESKHFKLGEHLLYVTESGLTTYMSLLGFKLLEKRDDETLIGRDNIKSFVFTRR